MAKQIKTLTDQGQPDEHIALALRLVADTGAHPAELPYALVKAVRQIKRGPVAAFVSEYGWPTGCKLGRGSHGVTHTYDPLGVERAPAGWPHERPARPQVEELLGVLVSVGAFLVGGFVK